MDSNKSLSTISVFTQTPFAISGISHISISRHHALLKNDSNIFDSLNSNKLKCHAINPLDDKHLIPIYLNEDDVYFGTLNANGQPYVDSKLGKFSKQFNLDII